MAAINSYRAIRQQLHNLQYSYFTLEKLLKDQRTIRLVNKSQAIEFFTYSCRNLCLIDVVLGIAKLLDKPDMGGKHNLTIMTLITELKSEGHSVGRLEEIHENLISNTGNIRAYRNTKVAHLDYDIHIKQREVLLYFNEMKKSMHLLCKFLKNVEKMLDLTFPHSYNYASAQIQADNNFAAMMRIIEDALTYRTLLERGRISIRGRYPEKQRLIRERL